MTSAITKQSEAPGNMMTQRHPQTSNLSSVLRPDMFGGTETASKTPKVERRGVREEAGSAAICHVH